MDPQKTSGSRSRLLLQPVHVLPQERVVGGDGYDLYSFLYWAACYVYNSGYTSIPIIKPSQETLQQDLDGINQTNT